MENCRPGTQNRPAVYSIRLDCVASMTSGEVPCRFLVRCPQQHEFRLLTYSRETCCFENDHNECRHIRTAFFRLRADV